MVAAGAAGFVAIQLGLPLPFGVWSVPVWSVADPVQRAAGRTFTRA
jgi:hypothetical protein